MLTVPIRPTADGLEFPIDLWVDTGFNGEIMMTLGDARALGTRILDDNWLTSLALLLVGLVLIGFVFLVARVREEERRDRERYQVGEEIRSGSEATSDRLSKPNARSKR